MATVDAHTPAQDDEQHPALTVLTLALFAAAIYVAVAVLALPLMAAIGFSVIVPSVIVSTLSAILRAAR
jgi:hypothetical protein